MSTIASPRGSISVRSPSSTRTSIDSTARPPTNARRNRAALRDYYGLKNATKEGDSKISEESTRTELGPEEDETLTELDASEFNAEGFVEDLLAREGLNGVLKVEADLLSRAFFLRAPTPAAESCLEIRNLDSDRKSLVYDNYSKLLSATSTIRRMRGNMDPLAPTTHTLGPAISHIAETAASLSSSMQDAQSRKTQPSINLQNAQNGTKNAAADKTQSQKELVRWVLDTPRRLHDLIDQEKDEEAEQDWAEVSLLLDKWQHVQGAKELKEECEDIMREDESE